MKICVTLSLIAFYISLVSSRPQSVQFERQKLLHLQRSITNEYQEKRGSMEETRRILQEIDRINLSLGYKKRMTLAFPRVAPGEGYFYPRQQFRPEFLTKQKINYNQNTLRMNNRRAIYPFNNQNYYYPTPYLQVPTEGKTHAFKTNKYFYPLIYAPFNILPFDERKSQNGKAADGSIKLGTIIVMQEDEDKYEREAKSVAESQKVKSAKQSEDNKTEPESESSLIEDIVNYVPEALGFSDEDEDERQETIVQKPKLPAIKNDKYLNLDLKKHPHETDDEERKLPPPMPMNANIRAFNFSNPIEKIQNFTKQFQFASRQEMLKETTERSSTLEQTPEDIQEAAEEKADDKEDEKSPFGFAFGPQQQLQTYKEGGLIIQRLRVRHGGIAIAGPGGVATAGSGGTAIVGPNGIALTHPRFEQVDDAVRLPYIGGAKGQVLEIRQRPDGTIFSRILTDQVKPDRRRIDDYDTLESTKGVAKPEEISFEESLAAIQRAAAELVTIQQTYKENGGLTDAQKRKYTENLEKLGISAQKLATVQNDDDYRLLFEEPQGDRIKGGSKKKPENIKFPPYSKKTTPTSTGELKKEECGEEESVGEEGDTTTASSTSSGPTSSLASTTTKTTTKAPPADTNNESVSINSSDGDDESSVAEAKPVGLAIAGEGGVASSKPVATAVVGPGGLAVARPVATAIAGVKPSDISALGLPIPSKLKDLSARGGSYPIKGKYGLVSLSDDENSDEKVLVGPNYFAQARLSEKMLDSDSNFDNDRAEVDDVEDEDQEMSKQPDLESEDENEDSKYNQNLNNNDRQVEPVDNSQNPFAFGFGHNPLFPPTYDGLYNYLQNPYLPPYSFNIPLPIVNQYLQRRAYNSGIRYPSLPSQYPGVYSQQQQLQAQQYNPQSPAFSPFSRFFFVQQ